MESLPALIFAEQSMKVFQHLNPEKVSKVIQYFYKVTGFQLLKVRSAKVAISKWYDRFKSRRERDDKETSDTTLFWRQKFEFFAQNRLISLALF